MCNWYAAISSKARPPIDALADWLDEIEWQYFVTLTFPWNVTAETGELKFKEFINEIERVHRTRVGYLVSRESRSKQGDSVPWHFHLCLAANKAIGKDVLTTTWRRLMNRQRATNDDSVKIDVYKRESRGIEYIAKMNNSPDAEWDLKSLEAFSPKIRALMTHNSQARRRQRRLDEQTNMPY